MKYFLTVLDVRLLILRLSQISFLVSLSLVSPNHFLAMPSLDIPSVCVSGERESEPVSLHIRTLIFMIPLNIY